MELPEEKCTVDIKHVLYATDHSESARCAFAYAERIAKQFNAKLTMLHVMREELPDLLVFDVGMEKFSSVEKRLSIEKEHLQKAESAFIDMAKAEYGQGAIDADNIVVVKGNPVKMILQVAEDRNCDLIVMGFKGRGTLEDALMGDTVRRVLNRSKLPVLVAQHPERK